MDRKNTWKRRTHFFQAPFFVIFDLVTFCRDSGLLDPADTLIYRRKCTPRAYNQNMWHLNNAHKKIGFFFGFFKI